MFTVIYKLKNHNELRTLDFTTMEEAVKCHIYLQEKLGLNSVKIHIDQEEGGFEKWKPQVFESWLQKEVKKEENKKAKQKLLEQLFTGKAS